MPQMRHTLLYLLLLCATATVAQKTSHTISGSVHDAKDGEDLYGATIAVKELPGQGVATNAYGYYSMTLPEGNYTLMVRYIGYEEYVLPIDLHASISQNINLSPVSIQIKQVEVTAKRKDENVKSAQMGVIKMEVKQLEKIPVIFGEKDILKTIQLLPGVKGAGEGNSGFYVRGGGVDQNLILLDEAPVYNASHALGFFSTFNNDAIKDFTLYKGNMPAEYGGRLASVLDIKMKEGNDKHYAVSGGIGLIASRLLVEGPIVKDKGSFLITGRRTYADLFLKLSSDTSINKSVLYFYDLNLKANYRLGKNDRLFASGYFGRDVLSLGTDFGIDYGNATATLRWNHIAGDRTFSNLSFIYNNFYWDINIGNADIKLNVQSRIRDFSLKEDIDYYLNTHNKIKLGLISTVHTVVPGVLTSQDTSRIASFALNKTYGWENGVYAQHEITLWDKVNINYGLRLSLFTMTGPANYYTFPTAYTSDTFRLNAWQFGKSYFNPEPRFSVSYNFAKNMSVKAAYSRTTQYIHLLSNTSTSNPTDRWVMSSNNIRPGISDQVSAGYFFNFHDNMYELSVEGYYKYMQNQIDYVNGAQLRANDLIESQLVYGVGRAYGGEVFLRKNSGKLTGWISYTLARTERTFSSINLGQWYPARYDRTHDVSIVAIYDITPKVSVSATWVYSTGNAVTYPIGKYNVVGAWTTRYGLRNQDRFPDYHRLDIGATFVLKKRKNWEHDLNISVYNVYGRANAYIINFDASTGKATETYLFRQIPSITYNFKFTALGKQKQPKPL
jgi:TonB dependent receptor/CarboxypepD_reg-like domain/TonB-dependent Receptor Plug Domain